MPRDIPVNSSLTSDTYTFQARASEYGLTIGEKDLILELQSVSKDCAKILKIYTSDKEIAQKIAFLINKKCAKRDIWDEIKNLIYK